MLKPLCSEFRILFLSLLGQTCVPVIEFTYSVEHQRVSEF